MEGRQWGGFRLVDFRRSPSDHVGIGVLVRAVCSDTATGTADKRVFGRHGLWGSVCRGLAAIMSAGAFVRNTPGQTLCLNVMGEYCVV